MLTYFTDSIPKEQVFSIGFYNLENLYDIFDDPDTLDEEFTPSSEKHWSLNRYKKKINNLGEVIAKIGTEHSMLPPIVLGVAEVENDQVLIDLVNNEHIKPFHYGFCHFDSPDPRGIDVAFLYQKEHFKLIKDQKHSLYLYDQEQNRHFTRDILSVKGKFLGELTYFLINHWPSRRDGLEETLWKRLAAGKLVTELIHDIRLQEPEAKIVVMGDFNDEPLDTSVQKMTVENQLYNPMQSLKDKFNGTSFSQKRWYLFDQILVTPNFFEKETGKLTLKYADVYDVRFIKTWEGKHKHTPYRTYIGKRHQGGFSDHFPVLAYLERL
ncbi:MAG: endonuclease [Flavobacteriaceae bacterium]|nr:endonuclease [Flavobacteriaceae bacterium]